MVGRQRIMGSLRIQPTVSFPLWFSRPFCVSLCVLLDSDMRYLINKLARTAQDTPWCVYPVSCFFFLHSSPTSSRTKQNFTPPLAYFSFWLKPHSLWKANKVDATRRHINPALFRSRAKAFSHVFLRHPWHQIKGPRRFPQPHPISSSVALEGFRSGKTKTLGPVSSVIYC